MRTSSNLCHHGRRGLFLLVACIVCYNLQHQSSSDDHQILRDQETKALSDLIQARLHALQNPADCNSTRKLVCTIETKNHTCGLGCQIHHDVFCFILAYATERMLVLGDKEWLDYDVPFKELFLPISETCQEPVQYSDLSMDASLTVEVCYFQIKSKDKDILGFLPPSIPKDVAERILGLHDDPIAWWVSQFVKFLLRPQPKLTSMLQAAESALGLEHPFVGVHIRRTDKITETKVYHDVEEYMMHVEKFYQEFGILKGHNRTVKRVFLSSDDPNVLKECQDKYPQYLFYYNATVAKDAYQYTNATMAGIITDFHILSQADFLVCTSSSNVCCLAYEMMQQAHPDAPSRFVSLDGVWALWGQGVQEWVAVMAHEGKGKEELELMVGDVVEIIGAPFYWTSKARNKRTGKIGIYPGNKIKKIEKMIDFPTYPHVKQ